MNIKRCSTCGIVTNDTCGNPKCDIPLEVPLFAKRSLEDTLEVNKDISGIIDVPSEYKTMSDKITKHHESYVERRKDVTEIANEIMDKHQNLFKRLAESEQNVSKKFDQGKPRLSLIPRSALIAAGEVLSFGAKKYDPHNWRKSGFDWSRLLDASLRHIQEWNDGTDLDKESGLNHIHHAMVNLMFLCEHIEKGMGKDDRYKKEEKKD